MPTDILESLKSQSALPQTAFTAEDCYKLRCKCLHQGLPERMGSDRVHFTAPDPNGQLHIHHNNLNGVLQLSIEQFCLDVCEAVLKWKIDVSNSNEITNRISELIKIYDLDNKELPIVRYG